jgi:hypothetical protein
VSKAATNPVRYRVMQSDAILILFAVALAMSVLFNLWLASLARARRHPPPPAACVKCGYDTRFTLDGR